MMSLTYAFMTMETARWTKIAHVSSDNLQESRRLLTVGPRTEVMCRR